MVSNILVYGDRRKYITALITLNPDSLHAFAKANGLDTRDPAELSRQKSVYASIEALVNTQNEHLAQFEKIKKFTILPTDFSAENNELTPTFKVKRKVVTEKYKHILDSMYDAEDIQLEGGTPAQTVAK